MGVTFSCFQTEPEPPGVTRRPHGETRLSLRCLRHLALPPRPPIHPVQQEHLKSTPPPSYAHINMYLLFEYVLLLHLDMYTILLICVKCTSQYVVLMLDM